MANTYTCLNYHIVFSTKNRTKWISSDLEQRIWEYIGGIAKSNNTLPVQIGGIEDHVHALVSAKPDIALSRIVQLLKGGSSKWIHETFPMLSRFEWQQGYGAFTVSNSQMPMVIEYIKRQREHHHKHSYESEFREFLVRHGVEFDERFVMG